MIDINDEFNIEDFLPDDLEIVKHGHPITKDFIPRPRVIQDDVAELLRKDHWEISAPYLNRNSYLDMSAYDNGVMVTIFYKHDVKSLTMYAMKKADKVTSRLKADYGVIVFDRPVDKLATHRAHKMNVLIIRKKDLPLLRQKLHSLQSRNR